MTPEQEKEQQLQKTNQIPRVDALEVGQAATFDILKGLLETYKLSQGYADHDGKKGYRFNGTDPGKCDAFVTSYMDHITDSMYTKQKLSILYRMVEKDAEEIFNLCHSLTKDPEERLAIIWEDLKNIYGHREREPRTELDPERSWSCMNISAREPISI